jgi:CheY-like chemotaxis protein
VRISQTLSNLVGNAIKFTESGGVSLNVTAQAWEGEQVILRFDVRDTGIGISQTAIERIFDPFSQEDASTTRRFGGTGLGLTISRQLAGLMGGELFVESKQGEGSCFSFTIAVSDAGEAAVGDNSGNAAAEMPARIVSHGLADGKTQGIDVLLAEDNNVNQIVACAMLKKLGCTITVAKDGQEALEHVKARHFDLILMDCHMPNLDGFAATAAIRELEKQGHPRHIIIAQTANAMEGDRESCLAAGMDDYISKPIAATALADVIQRWMPARSESAA